ncbi:MAG: hypothetical protein QOJ44_911 [Acidimicrobiaceae bacterium]|jgi:hypothetical protein|nr:hypothetical protein [Acidimicrobiaceae bacterium]
MNLTAPTGNPECAPALDDMEPRNPIGRIVVNR